MAAQGLSDELFAPIVRHAPLVSIDIVIRDPDGMVLVGLRTNEPARGFYFVPGSCVRKDERLEQAFARSLSSETGLRATIEQARFLGVYQHFYPTNRFHEPGFGTHYVVLAHELALAERPAIVLDDQHSACRWMSPAELAAASDVHPYTKAYV